MFSLMSDGSYKNTEKFLKSLVDGDAFDSFDKYGREGVSLLSNATPKLTGLASQSWEYKITHSKDKHILSWNNTDVEGGVNIAVILQYGHGTGTGGYVEGIDYINPALRPFFDRMIRDIWEELING